MRTWVAASRVHILDGKLRDSKAAHARTKAHLQQARDELRQARATHERELTLWKGRAAISQQQKQNVSASQKESLERMTTAEVGAGLPITTSQGKQQASWLTNYNKGTQRTI